MNPRTKSYLMILAGVLALASQAEAKNVCDTVAECQDLIQQAQARIQQLSGNAEEHFSNTGAVFTRDTSNPALGEAYKDPSGLIWGSIVMAGGKVNTMTQQAADSYCKAGGARLPTKEEFEQLAKYLGEGTAQGYSAKSTSGVDVLPGLSDHYFWSSSVVPSYSGDAYAFYGSNGYVVNDYRYNSLYAVRCVRGQ